MSIPANIIIMWSGAINEIPDGWFLCDGQNNTPDLRNIFVVGAGRTYSLNATGGNADAILPAHTHTVSGSTNTAPNHTHSGPGGYADNGPGGNVPIYRTYANSNIAMSSGGGHSHSVTLNSVGSSATGANLPPYYALAYIMSGGA